MSREICFPLIASFNVSKRNQYYILSLKKIVEFNYTVIPRKQWWHAWISLSSIMGSVELLTIFFTDNIKLTRDLHECHIMK